MALITEVRFAHADGALADTLAAGPDLTVRIVGDRSTTPDRNGYVFRFDGASPGTIRSLLETDHTVRHVEPVPAVDDGRLWRIEFAPETKLLAPCVTEEGGFVLDARSAVAPQVPRGWRERWFFPDENGMYEVWQRARTQGFEFEVLDLTQQLQSEADVDPDPLTDQQRTALVTAYEHGYFEEPRETSLEELAEILEVSPSAVNGRLRRGLKALVETALVVDGPEDTTSRLQKRNVPIRQ
ncbi:helix-turn-helix domain-containing protein [Natronobacterium texcoconense]|uniref:GAF and HTH_10 associated domain-containing protein n=1 Tax=Natronobacterium texcoconense TaxID=1095778 RepID=A0A1H1BWC2_NATTX|nr:helix-turn-helix domain-containing protein [Natronobacterium texcoconense]SDQ56234.1 GAF and HTH_10 associated domain-containing protein [Natronobacterium texcoconense]